MQNERQADLAIEGGTVIDGTGADAWRADIAIIGDRIVEIAEPGKLTARASETLDATEKVVCPGFIDVHTHDDNAVLSNPEMTAKISQGVTTVIVGNCGISLSPIRQIEPPPPMNLIGGREAFRFKSMSDYAASVDAARPSVNVAALVGHSTLRVGTMDDLNRKARIAELDAMRELLHDSLEAGAIGFSTGLWYKTNAGADINEVVALAEIVAAKGGVYTTHMRDEHDGVAASLDETFRTARKANVAVIISHHKCAGPKNWGRSTETLALIENARKQHPVSLDAYPYVAGSTVLEPEMVDPAIRITVSWSVPHPEMGGRDLSEIAEEWGCSQQDAARRLKPAGGIYFQMDEADMRRIISYPPTMIGSDGLPHDTHPHPRLWGTFPRVLGKFCRDEQLFSLVEAVHKMTGLSATNFGLKNRGRLGIGDFADIVVFDPDRITDRATFDNPTQAATGIDAVIVNGEIAWGGGELECTRNGRFIRRQ